MPRAAKPKAPKIAKPKSSQYEITSESGKRAFLDRVTTVLDWTIKGDGFGAMPYYGANLLLDFLLPDCDQEVKDGVAQLWKGSPHSPYARLKEAADRGEAAHTLHEHLILGIAVLTTEGPPWRVHYYREKWATHEERPVEEAPMDFVAVEYDAGTCKLYHEVTRFFDVVSEQRVFYTDHDIDDCPDEICTHGYAGTLDGLVVDELLMFDMKSNKGDARWAAYPQMAFYGRAALQRGLIPAPIQRQVVAIPRPDGEYEIFNDKFVDEGIVDPIRALYKYRRAWGPK